MAAGESEYLWRDGHSVHVEDMDVQHRRLIAFIDELQTALRSNRPRKVQSGILDRLVQFVYIHFADEEQFMEVNGFPGLLEHADIHRRFYLGLTELQQRFESGAGGLDDADMAAIFAWLEQHFVEADRKYGDYFALSSR